MLPANSTSIDITPDVSCEKIMTDEQLTIVTCSYGPDAKRCERLCRSVDRMVPRDIEHCIIVPRRDYQLFRNLQSDRRRVLVTEDVVPGGFFHLPIARKMWLSPDLWPVRGWIMQQITKLSASFAVNSELILFADSDIEFIRSLNKRLIYRGEQLRLHRVPEAMQEGTHRHWHNQAAQLLGQKPRYFGSDYVGQLITWRRSNLQALHRHIENTHSKPWYQPIAHSLRFSEYILYGAFVEHVVGIENSGHFFCHDDICHCCWLPSHANSLRNGTAVISHRAQAILLQSNMGLKAEQEEELFSAAQQAIKPIF
jgi:hypothetical protein